MSDRAIRSVAILGGGICGLSAAAAFARGLPGVRVTVIETPPDPAALVDRLPGSTTAIHRFHALIGLDEAALMRSGAATPRLGLRFEGWGGERWFHVHGDHGLPSGAVPFHQLWARARRAGRALQFHLYAAAGVLAEAGKFVHPQADPRSPLSTFDYGLRLDPLAYRVLLAALADSLGVVRSAGALASVERREDGGVASLRLQDGRRIEADLFVDASGPSAPLLDGDFEEWGQWLCFDRVAIGDAPVAPACPSDSLVAEAQGWRWSAPLADRTIAGSVGTGDIAIRPGRRADPWVRNVLAIGDAAVALDPLHWLPLHLAQTGIARALELIPGRDCAPVETAEYNRRAREEAERARDFAALHYLRWSQVPPPPGLARTLQQFEARGGLPSYDEDSLPEAYWIAALIGLGIVPQRTDPAAQAVDSEMAVARMAQIAEGLARIPAQLPGFADYLGRIRAP